MAKVRHSAKQIRRLVRRLAEIASEVGEKEPLPYQWVEYGMKFDADQRFAKDLEAGGGGEVGASGPVNPAIEAKVKANVSVRSDTDLDQDSELLIEVRGGAANYPR